MKMDRIFRVALIGNPNCGKTTIFNLLTGTHQHVGNYPGVTVERKRGVFRIGNLQIQLVDLPGIYSLSSSSLEEKITFNELLNEPIDLLIDVIDTSNPRRNLYLTSQLLELNIPLLVVLNMTDDAFRHGLFFNGSAMEQLIDGPVLKMVAREGKGLELLRHEIAEALGKPRARHFHPSYGQSMETALRPLTALVAGRCPESDRIPPRYFALKLLEEDEVIQAMPAMEGALELAKQTVGHLTSGSDGDGATVVALARYEFVDALCAACLRHRRKNHGGRTEKIDKILIHPIVGLPIFLLVMLCTFFLTFRVAQPFVDGIDWTFGKLIHLIHCHWSPGQPVFLKRLIVEGIIGGVGSVLLFLPNLIGLFACIEFLEGSGYMSRAAFLMDGLMRKFGLPGKSFIPMMLGFGCSVPAILSTRTIESRRDRLTTIMILPLISCGAKLPIYALIIPCFFPKNLQAPILLTIYCSGILLAFCGARLVRPLFAREDNEVYVLELPPYRLPILRDTLAHIFHRTAMFVQKAGTIILGASIILFFLNSFPQKRIFSRDYDSLAATIGSSPNAPETKNAQLADLLAEKQAEIFSYSYIGRIGDGLEHLLRPIGFDGRIGSALIGSFIAKELFLTQLGISYAVAHADENLLPLRHHLQENYSALQGFCVLLFILLASPCIAAIAAINRETQSWKITLYQVMALNIFAYTVTFLVFQIGSKIFS